MYIQRVLLSPLFCLLFLSGLVYKNTTLSCCIQYSGEESIVTVDCITDERVLFWPLSRCLFDWKTEWTTTATSLFDQTLNREEEEADQEEGGQK